MNQLDSCMPNFQNDKRIYPMTKNKINQSRKFGTAHVNAEQHIKNETTCKNRKM